jgi:ribose 5-phosphate isomerase B
MPELRPRQFTTIYLATDHAGFELKETIKAWLVAEGFEVVDGGATTYNSEDDFTDFVIPTVRAMTNAGANAGAVIFGGSGQGEAMAANRVPGARAVVYYGGNTAIPALGREHNNANTLSLGARFIDAAEAKWAVWEWLHTATLTDAKYERRNTKLDTL